MAQRSSSKAVDIAVAAAMGLALCVGVYQKIAAGGDMTAGAAPVPAAATHHQQQQLDATREHGEDPQDVPTARPQDAAAPGAAIASPQSAVGQRARRHAWSPADVIATTWVALLCGGAGVALASIADVAMSMHPVGNALCCAAAGVVAAGVQLFVPVNSGRPRMGGTMLLCVTAAAVVACAVSASPAVGASDLLTAMFPTSAAVRRPNLTGITEFGVEVIFPLCEIAVAPLAVFFEFLSDSEPITALGTLLLLGVAAVVVPSLLAAIAAAVAIAVVAAAVAVAFLLPVVLHLLLQLGDIIMAARLFLLLGIAVEFALVWTAPGKRLVRQARARRRGLA